MDKQLKELVGKMVTVVSKSLLNGGGGVKLNVRGVLEAPTEDGDSGWFLRQSDSGYGVEFDAEGVDEVIQQSTGAMIVLW